jgi:DNA-binding IscR family transcriptional regulator
MLEGGEYGSIEELARAEKINPSYLARVLRLTLLAPEIVERASSMDDTIRNGSLWTR